MRHPKGADNLIVRKVVKIVVAEHVVGGDFKAVVKLHGLHIAGRRAEVTAMDDKVHLLALGAVKDSAEALHPVGCPMLVDMNVGKDREFNLVHNVNLP